jgi:hypothetical protein
MRRTLATSGRRRGGDVPDRVSFLAPMIEAWRTGGITSQAGLAGALDAAGVPTARGGRWSNVQMAALLARIEGRREVAA